MAETSSGHNAGVVPEIMVFKPTYSEFQDFRSYIAHIEAMGAHKAGITKIIPPNEWTSRDGGYGNLDLMVPAPISQVVCGARGLYEQYNEPFEPLHVREFEELANSAKYRPPVHDDYDDLEHKYWKNITFNAPIYGADVGGSLTDKSQNIWNLQSLGSILDVAGEFGALNGSSSMLSVHTPHLYFGMWKTSVAWHTEDMDLYSLNYLHYGAPTTWYGVPPEHGHRLERLAEGFYPGPAQTCRSFLRHKTILMSPTVLKRYSIPVQKVTQEPGEMIITFPYSYNSSFNHGYNCAETANFATPRWIEYGKKCIQCTCSESDSTVKFEMDCFVRRFQPSQFMEWKFGPGAIPPSPGTLRDSSDVLSPRRLPSIEMLPKGLTSPRMSVDAAIRSHAGGLALDGQDDSQSDLRAQSGDNLPPPVNVAELPVEAPTTDSEWSDVDDKPFEDKHLDDCFETGVDVVQYNAELDDEEQHWARVRHSTLYSDTADEHTTGDVKTRILCAIRDRLCQMTQDDIIAKDPPGTYSHDGTTTGAQFNTGGGFQNNQSPFGIGLNDAIFGGANGPLHCMPPARYLYDERIDANPHSGDRELISNGDMYPHLGRRPSSGAVRDTDGTVIGAVDVYNGNPHGASSNSNEGRHRRAIQPQVTTNHTDWDNLMSGNDYEQPSYGNHRTNHGSNFTMNGKQEQQQYREAWENVAGEVELPGQPYIHKRHWPRYHPSWDSIYTEEKFNRDMSSLDIQSMTAHNEIYDLRRNINRHPGLYEDCHASPLSENPIQDLVEEDVSAPKAKKKKVPTATLR